MIARARRGGPRALACAAALGVLAPAVAFAGDGQPGPWSITTTAVPITVGATQMPGVTDLNEALDRAGYSRLGRIVPNLSLGITAFFASRLVVEPQYRFTISSSTDATLMVHHFLLNAGFLAYAHREIFLYPVIGFGLGNATLALEPKLEPQRFDEAVTDPSGEALLSASAFVLHGGLAANLWGSGNGDFIGIRTGVVHSPGPRAWKRRGIAVDAGPEPPMGGAYLALALGFRAPGVRQKPLNTTGRR